MQWHGLTPSSVLQVRVVDHSSPSAQSSSSSAGGGGPRLSNRDVDSCLGVTSRTTITLPLAPRGAKQGEAMGVLQVRAMTYTGAHAKTVAPSLS